MLMILFAVFFITCSSICCAKRPADLKGWPDIHPPKGFHSEPREVDNDLLPFHSPQLQSPIDIKTSDAFKVKLPRLHFENLLNRGVMVTMKNTGSTVEFTIAGDSKMKPRLVGGPLEAHGQFEFESLHIHWGTHDTLGGEHTINNERLGVEGHCVHYNLKYGNYEEAKKHSDGLAVVAFFAEAQPCNNRKISHLINKVPNIKCPGASVTLPARKSLKWFAALGESNHYYTYPGSLTTAPYTENVFWIVYPEPMKIGSRQIEAFRNIYTSDYKKNKNNTQIIQPFNGRPLIFNE